MIHIITGFYRVNYDKSITLSTFLCRKLNYLSDKGYKYKIYIEHPIYSKITITIYKLFHKSDVLSHMKENISLDNKNTITTIINKYNLLNYLIPELSIDRRVINSIIYFNCNSNDVIHIHGAFPAGYYGIKLAKKLGVASVITVYGSEIDDSLNNIRNKHAMLWTLENADKVIFVSQAQLTNAVNKGYSGKNSAVIFNGVNLKKFYPSKYADAELKTRWKKTKRYVVGYIGRLSYEKGVDRLPDIFQNIFEMCDDVEFIIVGSGNYFEEIKNKCNKYVYQVSFIPEVKPDTVVYWMNLLDVLLIPSRNEGYPGVIQEAFACGIPIVASDVGGIKEALCNVCTSIPNGKNFNKQFSEAVYSILKNPIKKETLISIAKQHSLDISVDKEIDIYRSLPNN